MRATQLGHFIFPGDLKIIIAKYKAEECVINIKTRERVNINMCLKMCGFLVELKDYIQQ
jgi:hypothetical protein